MKKLIEALHVIQEECEKHGAFCENCPLSKSYKDHVECIPRTTNPNHWIINSEVQKALL